MTKSNGITSLKQAAKLLNKHSPDGESLAYINKDEAKLLRSHGGSGIQTLAGVPSYLSIFGWQVPGTKTEAEGGWTGTQLLGNIFGYGDQTVLDKDRNEVQVAGRSPFQDAIAVYAFLRAKKDQGKLNEAEMAEFNRLDAQLTAGKQEFTGYVDEGKQLTAPEYVTTPQAVTRDIDFSGETTPELITTPRAQGGRIGYQLGEEVEQVTEEFPSALEAQADFDVANIRGTNTQQQIQKLVQEIMKLYKNVDIKDAIGLARQIIETQPEWFAQGGRIGAFNGGIQGLMPQQGMPQQGFMPQQGLDPRMGYAHGIGPHGVEIPTFSEGVNQEFPSNELGALEAQSNIDVSKIHAQNKEQQIQKLIQEIMGLYEDIDIKDAIGLARQILEAHPERFAQGGRIGYRGGSGYNWRKRYDYLMDKKVGGVDLTNDEEDELQMIEITILDVDRSGDAQGGRIGAQGGGIMPLLDMGGMEKDYRQEGGFVPIGRKEKADDVPARLSKNEFVFTADAVKAAGGGDIDEGAQRMYNVMKNLEAGGQISQQSQGKA